MNENDIALLFPKIKQKEKHQMMLRDGINITLYKFFPEENGNQKSKSIILLIPGFCAYLGVWNTIIKGLIDKGYPIIVLETREKKSSTSKVTDENFNANGIIDDVRDALQQLKLKQPFYMIGNSLGSALIVKHIANNLEIKEILPERITLLQAVYTSESLNNQIRLAKFKLLYKIAMKLVAFFAPVIFWRKRRIEPKTYEVLIGNIKHADLEKMRVGLLHSMDLEIFKDLPKIEIPSLIIGYSNDNIHPVEQAQVIYQSVKNGAFLEVKEREKLHSQETVDIITNFLSN